MQARIAINPHIHFGKPCVARTRITVQSVLELLDEGLSFAEIIENYYPDLKTDDIHACLVQRSAHFRYNLTHNSSDSEEFS